MTTTAPRRASRLIEGWMFGRLLFPLAMDEVGRVPPANDDED